MGDMAQTVSHSAVKVAVMCATESMGFVTVNLAGMEHVVAANVAIDARMEHVIHAMVGALAARLVIMVTIVRSPVEITAWMDVIKVLLFV